MNNEMIKLIALTDHKTLVAWALDCAEHVLPYFEDVNKDDKRPRLAIEAGRLWLREEVTVGYVRKAAFAAHAAARDTDNINARLAARSAGQAAATVHVKTHAIHAANYAFKIRETELIWQYNHLLELTKTTM